MRFTLRSIILCCVALGSVGCEAVYFRGPLLDFIGPTVAVAVPTGGGVVNAGQAALLNGSSSYLQMGSGTRIGATEAGFTFAWTVASTPAGAVAPTLANDNSTQPTFTATTTGRYTVELAVTDGTNSGTSSVTIDVL